MILAINNISHLVLPEEKILKLLSIYENKGKVDYYKTTFSAKEKVFAKRRLIENVYYLAKLLEVKADDERIKRFAKGNYESKNNADRLINNLKNALVKNDIFSKDYDISANEIKDLVKLLGNGIKEVKPMPLKEEFVNSIINNANEKINNFTIFLEQYVNNFHSVYHRRKSELCLIFLSLFLDLSQMKLFNDYNLEMAIILFYGFLEKHFSMFKYISFFKVVYSYEIKLKQYLKATFVNYENQMVNVIPLLELLIDCLNQSITDITNLEREVSFELGTNKNVAVENVILKGPSVFCRDDIKRALPNISDTTINRAFKRLSDERKIMPLGTGRSAKWQRIVEGESEIVNFGLFAIADFDATNDNQDK